MNTPLLETLREYQKQGAEFLSTLSFGQRAKILADPPGYGKTRQALAAAYYCLQKAKPSDSKAIIVFTTAIGRGDWIREAEKFWPDLRTYMVGLEPVYQKVNESDEAFDKRRFSKLSALLQDIEIPSLIACTYDSAEKIYDIVKKHNLLLSYIIADEAHHLKTKSTIRAKTIRPLIARSAATALMTGTPIHNHVIDLHQLLDLCSLGKFGTKWTLAYKYFKIIEKQVGHRSFPQIGELIDKSGLNNDIKDYILSRDIKTAYGELPARIRELVKVKVDGGLARAVSLQGRNQTGQLDSLLRKAATLKLNTVVQMAIDMNEPLVIYTYTRNDAREIADRLKKKRVYTVLATGEDVPARRDEKIEQWKHGNNRVLVCTMDAVRESATLTRASAMIFADLDWLPGKMLQCEGRIDPSRQPENERRPVRYFYVVTEGGYDEVVAERVCEKIANAQGVVGNNESANALATCFAPMKNEIVKETPAEIMQDLISRIESRSDRLKELVDDEWDD